MKNLMNCMNFSTVHKKSQRVEAVVHRTGFTLIPLQTPLRLEAHWQAHETCMTVCDTHGSSDMRMCA